MKKIVLYIIFIIISLNCRGQNDTLILQQINFKDKILENILINISKSDCFKDTEFYILDFFKSSLSSDVYYLSIKEFKSKIQNSMVYYVVINNIVFFVSDDIPNGLFTIQLSKKKFTLRKEKKSSYPRGDFNFLLYGTLNGFYKVIYKTCYE